MAARIALELTQLPPTLSIERAAKLLGLSRSSAYRAAANGQLPTLAFGRRLFVPTVRLLEMLGFQIEDSEPRVVVRAAGIDVPERAGTRALAPGELRALRPDQAEFRALYEGIARSNATLKLAASVTDLADANRIAGLFLAGFASGGASGSVRARRALDAAVTNALPIRLMRK